MRVNNVFSGRPAWYDRAPLMAVGYINVTTIPAGNTTRWTYTVPSARKSAIESVIALLTRITVAAPVGLAVLQLNYNINGGGGATLVQAQLLNNAVDAFDRESKGSIGYMLAGDNLQCITSDASTGGTCSFLGAAKLTEFDA